MTSTDLTQVKTYLEKQKDLSNVNFTNLKRWLQIQETTSTFNNTSPALVATLIDLCFKYNLNPIQNDIYLLPLQYGKPPQIFLSYDAMYRIALSTKDLEYWNVNEIWDKNDETNLIRVDITVKRESQKQPTTLSYLMKEWKKNTKGPWETMPAFMLRKCAIARTFSLLFQDVFSECNYYTDAEIWTQEQQNTINTNEQEFKKIESELNNYND